MLGQQLRRQRVALLEHRVQHGARVVPAGAAAALRVHRPQLGGVLLALQLHRACGHQGHAEARSAGGKDTVEPASGELTNHW